MRILMLMAEGMEGGDSSIATPSSRASSSDANATLSAMLKAMCSTDKDGTYCVLQPAFQSMVDGGEGDSPAATAMCSLCGKKMMQATGKALPKAERASLSKQMAAGCFKKGDKFCADFISAGPPTWDTVVKDCSAPENPADQISIPDR